MRAKHPVQLGLIDTLWFVGIASVYLGLAYATRRWAGLAPLTVIAAVAVFIATVFVEFSIVLDGDDWWDDFRAQNRLIVLVLLAQVVAVSCGWWVGWWIAG